MGIAEDLAKFSTRQFSPHLKEMKRAERAYREPVYNRVREYKITIKDVVFWHLPEAIAAVSSNGKYQFLQRQLYYQMRPIVQRELGKNLESGTFSNLINEYQENEGEIPGLCFDARGNFISPHRGSVVPLGTTAVQNYSVPTDEFQAILYIEKEGFREILLPLHFPQRFDIAVAFGKGYGTRAAKTLLDDASSQGIKLLVCHDCDVDGYGISLTLQQETGTFDRGLEIVDVGLTVAQATKMGLETEVAPRRKRDVSWRVSNSLTPEETDFLIRRRLRCELNAMTTEQFIEFLEGKLIENGLGEKLIPDKDTIAETFGQESAKVLQDASRDIAAAAVAEILGTTIEDLAAGVFEKDLRAGQNPPDSFFARMKKQLNDDDQYREIWWRAYVAQQATKRAGRFADGRRASIIERLTEELRNRGQVG